MEHPTDTSTGSQSYHCVFLQVFTPLEASLPNLNRAKHGHVHGHLQLDHKPGDKHTSSSVEDCFAKVA